MISTTIRVTVILAAVTVLTGGAAMAQSQPAIEPGVKVLTPAAEPTAAAPTTPTAPTTAPTTQGGATTQPGQGGACGQMGGNGPMLAMMAGVIALFWFMGRGKRKQESSRRDMLSNLKKGDKITTIGGIIGTILDVREDEVVVKIDDDSRIHMARWAIRGVGEAAKAENPEKAAKKEQEKK
ncbi:MAG: preprotein translocase subunit YajC [Planctomycetota bacterium]|nr:preprotein translocase subunit YajC [Planctomycetota bacterium]